MTRMDCAGFADVADELALGMLTGVERARALDHLDRCDRCGKLVGELSRTADKLFELAPPMEPPVGFESRVLGRAVQKPARRRLIWVWPAAAMAAAAAWLGIALTSPSPPATPRFVSAPLVADGHPVGALVAYRGSPGWVYMSVDVGQMSGPVTCELSQRGGATVRLGSFVLHDGYGYWDAPVRADFAQVTGARLVGAGGAVLASARFDR